MTQFLGQISRLEVGAAGVTRREVAVGIPLEPGRPDPLDRRDRFIQPLLDEGPE
jgi:hypothetical protein